MSMSKRRLGPLIVGLAAASMLPHSVVIPNRVFALGRGPEVPPGTTAHDLERLEKARLKRERKAKSK
jgi:hypothetical protein